MKKLKWYYKNGKTFEKYSVLYENDKYILVQNDNTKKYSFGLSRDFGSFYGFPVNQSCLSADELKAQLLAFIEIDKKYNNVNQTQKIYESMLEAI